MKVCVVSLDLHHPAGVYQLLNNELHRMNFERLQRHLWAGVSDSTPQRIKTTLMECVRPDDGIFVFAQEHSLDDYASHNPTLD
jgi:hypothetical protein